MINKPKYKIARRLGAAIFEKTQTKKFADKKDAKKSFGGRPKSAYGIQLNEKQKARLTYGISEKQFKNYVSKILAKKSNDPQSDLFESLEKRIDNTVYRAGFARTRREARQIVSHGHVKLNGTRITIPSIVVKKSDIISIKEQSHTKGIYTTLDDRSKDITTPEWLVTDFKKKEATIIGVPSHKSGDLLFDLGAIIEYYRR